MKASVAMATYNGEKYIKEQLESIMSQTVLPYEIVISDDGSTDQTMIIVNEFVEQYRVSNPASVSTLSGVWKPRFRF